MLEVPIAAKILPVLLAGWLIITSPIPFEGEHNIRTKVSFQNERYTGEWIKEKPINPNSKTDHIKFRVNNRGRGTIDSIIITRKNGEELVWDWQGRMSDFCWNEDYKTFDNLEFFYEYITPVEKNIIKKREGNILGR